MVAQTYNVLFLCTGNSARSIMAEALLSRRGSPTFRAFSAGSKPKGQVHPMSLDTLGRNNFRTDHFRSKSWNEFTSPDSPKLDFIITVCSNAANETCPVIPGKPLNAHWDIDDPARSFNSDDEQQRAFETVFIELDRRIQLLVELPIDKMDKVVLQEHLREMSDPN